MAPTATDFRSLQAPQRCSERVGSVVRPMLVSIGAPGSYEGRPVGCLAAAGCPLVRFVRELGRTHSKLGKERYDTGEPYGAGVAAFAAG